MFRQSDFRRTVVMGLLTGILYSLCSNTMASEFRSTTIEFSGRPLHFVELHNDSGGQTKMPVVFVHGTPGGWDDYRIFLSLIHI